MCTDVNTVGVIISDLCVLICIFSSQYVALLGMTLNFDSLWKEANTWSCEPWTDANLTVPR